MGLERGDEVIGGKCVMRSKNLMMEVMIKGVEVWGAGGRA